MKEKGNQNQHSERYGNYVPPIGNCRGGLEGEPLHGLLTFEGIQEVKSIRLAANINDQEAKVAKLKCPRQDEVEIAYFPKEIVSRESVFLTPIVGAICLKTDCEYNLSRPAKKS